MTSDKRAAELTPELKEAIGDYLIYEHGCCGGQRTVMWRHLYGLENDDAHDYEVDYCAARSFAETTDKEKLKVARVVRDGKTGILKGPFCQVFLSFPQTKEIPELMEQKDPPKKLPFRKFCLLAHAYSSSLIMPKNNLRWRT